MNLKATLIAAVLAPTFAFAQAYDPATGTRYDQYGRPLPSVEQLCREGQMAGGPVTMQCAMHGYRFNKKGEALTRYDFSKWGYNVLDDGVTVSDAQRLDNDPAFRAKYIKRNGYEQYKVAGTPPSINITPFSGDHSDGTCRTESDLAYQIAQASAKGIPIETVRENMTKVLTDNNVSTAEFNRNIQMVNRAYAWQRHGYTLDQIRDADFQACKGTPVLDIPNLSE